RHRRHRRSPAVARRRGHLVAARAALARAAQRVAGHHRGGTAGRMSQAPSRDRFDAVVIGAGIVGSACAYYLSRAGLRVAVAERGTVASGTTGAGEGNILISDKEPGP